MTFDKEQEDFLKRVNIELVSASPTAKEQLRKFLVKEKIAFTEANSQDPHFEYGFRLVFWATEEMNAALVPGHAENSFILWSKLDNKTIGVAICVIQKQDDKLVLITSFLGVGWEYRRHGLGRLLLRRKHKELKKRGIRRYKANVWENSKKLLLSEQKAGQLQVVEDPSDPLELTITLL